MEQHEEDRLSSLPEIILHCILSKLPVEDAARTSVLSKSWLDAWYTFPILSFSERSLEQRMEESERMRKILEFCDYVKRRLLRFRDQSLAIKEFKLEVKCTGVCHISKDVDIWLKLACECGVEVIEYSQDVSEGWDEYYVLPMYVIEAKSITKLVLEGYIMIDPTFTNHSIKFSSLRVLSLCWIIFGDEHAINRLISFCPLIESINLRYCYVFNSNSYRTIKRRKPLSISGLQKLKSVVTCEIYDVSIDAPSLETLCYHCPFDFNAPLKIDFDRCGNLKELQMWSMKDTFFTDKWFLEQFLKFPFLESLMLNNCKIPERIDISCVCLKVLELSYCSKLKEINIDAPNLLSCDYKGSGTSEPTISFSRNSSQLKVNIQIHVDYVDLCNLREFVQNIKPNDVLTSLSLSLSIGGMSNVDALDPVALQVSSPLPRIKHLDISYLSSSKHLFSSVVNILLSSCCPSTISLRCISLCSKEFVEFFYEMLMRRKEGECFCSFYDTKCWWHDLKDVKVTSPMKMDENVDFKTILESLAFPSFESISFRLDF